MPIANNGNQGGIGMWPSENWASTLYNWANVGLIAGLIIGAVSTIMLVWMGNVKEGYLKQELVQTGLQTAKLEHDNLLMAGTVANLQETASKQQERAAKAEKDLLEIRKQVASRRLTGEQKTALAKFLEKAPNKVAIVSALLDSESADFADDFDSAFKLAHWETLRIWNRGTIEKGVSVGTVGNGHPIETKLISAALTSIGVAHKEETFRDDDHSTSPWFQANVLYVVVNKKPDATIATNAHLKAK
jgi:hypothetical protein